MAYMVRNPGLLPSSKLLGRGELRRKRVMMQHIIDRCWLSCFDPKGFNSEPFVADAIIANPPSLAHVHCAQKLGIPLHMVFTYEHSVHHVTSLCLPLVQDAVVPNPSVWSSARQCSTVRRGQINIELSLVHIDRRDDLARPQGSDQYVSHKDAGFRTHQFVMGFSVASPTEDTNVLLLVGLLIFSANNTLSNSQVSESCSQAKRLAEPHISHRLLQSKVRPRLSTS